MHRFFPIGKILMNNNRFKFLLKLIKFKNFRITFDFFSRNWNVSFAGATYIHIYKILCKNEKLPIALL